MHAEQESRTPERMLLIGRTPEAYVLEAVPPLTRDEVSELSVQPVFDTELPNGQRDVTFPADAFNGIQDMLGFAGRVAETLGNCAVNPRIIQIMDCRYPIADH